MSLITPIQDLVMVRMDPFESTWGDSGLVRPDIAREMPLTGQVVGRGRGARGVNRGERVAIPWRCGRDTTINGQLYRFVRESEILGVVEQT